MDPRHLLQLSVVLDKGSISAASQHLALTQPTLTRNMQTLEHQAGGRLFSRSRFGVRSTPLGERLAREGRVVAQSLGTARDLAARHRLGIEGELRVGVGPLIAISVMPALTLRLLTDRAHLAMSVRCDTPNLLLDTLIDGDLDFLVGQPIGVNSISGFVRIPLLDDELGPFCGADHPLATKVRIDAADLARSEWIVMGATNHFERSTLELLADHDVRTMNRQLVTSGDASTLLGVLTHGRHVAMLPRRLMRNIGLRYRLHELPIVGLRPVAHQVSLWHRQSITDDAGYAALAGEIIAEFARIKRDTEPPASRSTPEAARGARRRA